MLGCKRHAKAKVKLNILECMACFFIYFLHIYVKIKICRSFYIACHRKCINIFIGRKFYFWQSHFRYSVIKASENNIPHRFLRIVNVVYAFPLRRTKIFIPDSVYISVYKYIWIHCILVKIAMRCTNTYSVEKIVFKQLAQFGFFIASRMIMFLKSEPKRYLLSII